MRWKILRAPMMADTMTDRPGRVSTMSAAPRAASVAPAAKAKVPSDAAWQAWQWKAKALSKSHLACTWEYVKVMLLFKPHSLQASTSGTCGTGLNMTMHSRAP